MPDISKCSNTLCPLNEDCYRFTCEPNPDWQSYADFQYDNKQKKCDYFMQKLPEWIRNYENKYKNN